MGHISEMGRRHLSHMTGDILASAFGDRPFTAVQAFSIHGITAERLRSAIRSGALTRLRRGTYVVSSSSCVDDDDHQGSVSPALDRARAAALAQPGSAVSHASAAALHGLPLPHGLGGQAHITCPGTRPRISQGVRIHVSPLPPEHLTMLDGVLVTTLARTAVDLARHLAPPRALICVDAALRRLVEQRSPLRADLRRCVHDEGLISDAASVFTGVLDYQAGWPGIRRARATVALGDPAAESPLESESRGILLLRGVPAPVVGAPVVGANGVTYWADMLWEDRRVVGECDGGMKYSSSEALIKEKLRQEELEQAGLRIVRWMFYDLRNPWRLVDRVNRALGLC